MMTRFQEMFHEKALPTQQLTSRLSNHLPPILSRWTSWPLVTLPDKRQGQTPLTESLYNLPHLLTFYLAFSQSLWLLSTQQTSSPRSSFLFLQSCPDSWLTDPHFLLTPFPLSLCCITAFSLSEPFKLFWDYCQLPYINLVVTFKLHLFKRGGCVPQYL